MPLDKSFDHAAIEQRLYAKWEQSGAFACDPGSPAPPFTLMMPPPNVTGSLHMGHALTFTLQDVLVRYQRMRGRDALWQPGTDHAGIATQMVVEKQLAAAKQPGRRDMGRDAFLKKVWEWKAESGGTITSQLRRLGASCDWSRERFTMDDGLSKAVTREFVQLYRDGLIFKDKRLVNWDPKLLTAVSDLEVEQKELKGHMWHFKYPLVKDPSQFICIATTRPETMLGDGAVAVNPKDERYQHLIGQWAVLPLTGRTIPIIADEYANPEKGSGAVKITAAHDFNDFEVWKRHREQEYFKSQQEGGLINLFDQHAKLNDNAPAAFCGLDRFDARKKVIAEMEALELVDKIEPLTHVVPHSERSGVVIEPWLSEQWYCDAKTLAEPAIKAVESGAIKFVPEQWTNSFYAWMRDIQPWCISRQLWWGHQIPVWYAEDGAYFVAETEEEAAQAAQQQCGKPIALTRDEDVLDTWFSSALWPFSTLGWPEQTPELARYYPTDVLITGFDILFFWVARMMMMGLHFVQDVPFRTVYMHALVRDEKGQKMSKSKGNVIDPLTIIDQYGCDALRFTLAHMSTPGRDIRLSVPRIEGNRNFTTKLWNAARFCEMNECAWQKDFDPALAQQPVNRWIIGEVKRAADKIASLLDTFRFDLSASAAYEFVWNVFCDWYLEFTKPILTGADDAAKLETRATTAWALGQALHILHPFMPYVTEELWGQLAGQGLLMTAEWPALPDTLQAKTDMGWVKELIEKIRTTRVELNVPGGAKIALLVKGADAGLQARFTASMPVINRMARLADTDPITFVVEVPKGSAQIVFGDLILALPLAGVIDIDAERARLAKEAEKWQSEIAKVDAKLANENFVSRAPEEILIEHRARKAEAEAAITRLTVAMQALAG